MLLRPMPATLSSAPLVGGLATVERPPECPSTARTFTPGRAQWTRVDGRRHEGAGHEARGSRALPFCGA
jgi:hypothetical protein